MKRFSLLVLLVLCARDAEAGRAAKDVRSLDVPSSVKRTFQDLDRHIGRRPSNLALIGPKGSGETALAKAYARMLKERGRIADAHVLVIEPESLATFRARIGAAKGVVLVKNLGNVPDGERRGMVNALVQEMAMERHTFVLSEHDNQSLQRLIHDNRALVQHVLEKIDLRGSERR